MPKGGFGNLIALPLQKERRKHGFTEFVDEFFTPFPDQWKVLTDIRRLGHNELRAILEQSLEADLSINATALEIEEFIMEHAFGKILDLPLIPDWKAFLAENLIIPTTHLSDRMAARLKSLATFPNPLFFEKQRQRFPTYNIPRYLFSGEIHRDRIVLPRGCIEAAIELFAECGSRLEIEDRRLKPKGIRIVFEGKLFPQQKTALNKILDHEHGILVAPPGSGKTVIACAIIAKRKTPALILVNRQTLLDQWLVRFQEFLGLQKKEIGQWRGTRKKATGRIDIAMIQTLANHENPKAFFREYGLVIIDECHHIPAVTLEALLKECGSKFILGLTATPERKDRLERLLYQQCGPIRYELEAGVPGQLDRQVFVRTTPFSALTDDGGPLPLHLTWERMTGHRERNELIVEDILAAIHENRAPMVLSDRKEHLESLCGLLLEANLGDGAVFRIVDGSLSSRQRQQIIDSFIDALAARQPACLFATSSLLGEGFDLPVLDTLVLAMPISFKGRLIQYAGRLHRTSPGKSKVIIYDYLDEQMALTMSMYRRRLPAYRHMGYKIIRD